MIRKLLLPALIFFAILTSCSKGEETPVLDVPKSTYWIDADMGVVFVGTVQECTLTGTDIEKKTISNGHLLTPDFTKGKVITITLTGTKGDPELYLSLYKATKISATSVSRGTKVESKYGRGQISITFFVE